MLKIWIWIVCREPYSHHKCHKYELEQFIINKCNEFPCLNFNAFQTIIILVLEPTTFSPVVFFLPLLSMPLSLPYYIVLCIHARVFSFSSLPSLYLFIFTHECLCLVLTSYVSPALAPSKCFRLFTIYMNN